MTAPTPEERAAWRGLADAATPGPWQYDGNPSGWVRSEAGPGVHERAWIQWADGSTTSALPDAAFIAAARDAVPCLLDALDAMEQKVRDLGGEP